MQLALSKSKRQTKQFGDQSRVITKSKSLLHLAMIILILSFLTMKIKSQCGDGCLRCVASTKNCEICDGVNNYFTDGKGTCEKKTRDNCMTLDERGDCKVCNASFKPNSSTGECNPINQTKKVENCLYYDEFNNCSECENGFYPAHEHCDRVLIPIENCDKYKENDPKICDRCEKGFILTLDATGCVQVDASENCSVYNYFDCAECETGQYYDPNAYITNLISNSKTLFEYYRDIVDGRFETRISQFCITPTVTHCDSMLFGSNCMKCSDGYYRNPNGTCAKKPLEPMQNCKLYSGEGVCSQCQDGFYVENNQCKKHTTQNECLNYATDKNQCSECNAGFYLDLNKRCTSRENSLNDTNCEIYETDSDACKTCKKDWVLNSVGRCKEGIKDCETYSATIPTPECQQCRDTYFFDAGAGWCQQPLDFATNPCLKYADAANKCRECRQGYYKAADTCATHTNLDIQCKEASLTAQDECTKCNSGYGLFQNWKVCVAVTTPNNNCKKWKNATECESCEEGYLPPNCEAIPPEENCLVRNPGEQKCIKCQSSYFSNSNTGDKCVTALDFEKPNCIEFSLQNGKSIVQCDSCVKGAIFMEIQDFWGCTKRTNLANPATFENCLMVNVTNQGTQNEAYVCQKCNDGFVIKDDKSCVKTCPENFVRARTKISIDAGDSDRLGIEAVNICVPQSEVNTTNCELAVPVVDEGVNNKYVCVKCVSGFDKVLDFKAQNLIHNYNLDGDHYDNIVETTGSFNCETVTMQANYLKDNCDMFGKLTAGTYGCVRCSWGFSGVIKKPVNDQDEYFIKECQAITGCNVSDTNTVGLTTPESFTKWKIPLESFVSCTKCTKKEEMPVLILRIEGTVDENNNNTLSLIWFNVLNFITNENFNYETSDSQANGIPMQCINPTVGSQFGYKEDYEVAYPEGCAMLLYRIDKKPVEDKNYKSNDPVIICASCDRGYRVKTRPALNTDVDSIQECEAIQNCKLSVWFNACSECESKFIYEYDLTTKKIKYDKCVDEPWENSNCFATSDSKKCDICKKGYSINDEGFCEDLNFSNCVSSHFLSRIPLYLKKETLTNPRQTLSNPPPDPLPTVNLHNISTVLYFHGQHNLGSKKYGCSKCDGDYLAITGLPSEGHCVSSSYIDAGKFNNLKFIEKCIQFGWDFLNKKHLCRQCILGYMPNFSGTKCVTRLPYCIKASINGDSFCSECQEGFTLINNDCVQNSITNCLEYSVQDGGLICNKCSNEYYLYNNKLCLAGKVENCLQYVNNQPFKCTQCKSEYANFQIQNGNSLCLPFSGQNCAEWEPKNTNGRFECSLCNANYYITDFNSSMLSRLCFGPIPIENCDDVNVILTGTDTLQYECTKCSDGYYKFNSGTSCLQLDAVEFCKSFSTDSNRCLECETDYYIDYTGKSCSPYPKGIFGCEIYLNAGHCFKCGPNMYLAADQCHVIDPQDWIENCAYYTSKEICMECISGYYLTKNECKSASAINCLTYKDSNTCETCPNGYGLKTIDNLVNCVLITISNCHKSTLKAPFECIICNRGYYQSGGGCHTADKIVNCEYYFTKNQCLTCKQGYLLSPEKTQCLSVAEQAFPMDSKCINSFIGLKRVCAACTPGHFLSEGLCKPCNAGDKCMFCDPNDATLCLVCAPGTQMKEDGTCEGTPVKVFADHIIASSITATDGTSNVDEHIQKISSFTIILIMFALLSAIRD